MKKKLLTALSIFPILTGCSNTSDVKFTPVSFNCSGFFEGISYHTPLNTAVTLTMYNKEKLNLIEYDFQDDINSLHKDIDAYFEYKDINNIYKINSNPNTPIKVSDNLFELLSKGVELTKLSKGNMNILMGSTIDLWKDKFEEGERFNTDPDKNLIEKSLLSIPSYLDINNHLILNTTTKEVTLVPLNEDTKINLGAIAKGFALDKTSYLFNDDPAIISAGTSSLRLNGNHPSKDRDYYIINLKEPINHDLIINAPFINIKVDPNMNLSTSGDYEKCFRVTNELGDTIFRSHILNPETGYSSNYHAQICVISSLDGIILDALSTTLMNLKTNEEIKKMVEEYETYYGASISYGIFDRLTDSTYALSYNSSFKDSIYGEISSSIKTKIDI